MDLNQEISFEKKDDVLGNYYIIYEEFLESLMNIPTIIILPVKLVSYLLWKLVKVLPNYHWRGMKFSPCTFVYNQFMMKLKFLQNWINNTYGVLNPENLFENIHFHFLPLALRVISHFIFVLNYGFSFIMYIAMKYLSMGHCRNISVLSVNNENGYINFKNNYLKLN